MATEHFWKINFPATYLSMMYTTPLYRVSGMQSLFLVLNFLFQVKVMSKPRWLSNAILKIELLNWLSLNDV